MLSMNFRVEKRILFFLISLGVVAFTAACSGVEIVSRSQWSARPPSQRKTIRTPVEHVIIIHTFTQQCFSKESCSALMRNMQDNHMTYRGMHDIAYNFAIGGDGRVYEGRGWNQEGNHISGWNSKSYGIAFIGMYNKITPNATMLNAARSLIVCGVLSGRISENRQLHGARDVTCTESPGDKLYEIIKHWPMFEGRVPSFRCIL